MEYDHRPGRSGETQSLHAGPPSQKSGMAQAAPSGRRSAAVALTSRYGLPYAPVCSRTFSNMPKRGTSPAPMSSTPSRTYTIPSKPGMAPSGSPRSHGGIGSTPRDQRDHVESGRGDPRSAICTAPASAGSRAAGLVQERAGFLDVQEVVESPWQPSAPKSLRTTQAASKKPFHVSSAGIPLSRPFISSLRGPSAQPRGACPGARRAPHRRQPAAASPRAPLWHPGP